MKVVIKFCGGCDPAFDRVEVFQRVKTVAGDSIEWLQVEQQATRLFSWFVDAARLALKKPYGTSPDWYQ